MNSFRITGWPATLRSIHGGKQLLTLGIFPPEREPLGMFPTVVWEHRRPLPGLDDGIDETIPLRQRPALEVCGLLRVVDHAEPPARGVRRILARSGYSRWAPEVIEAVMQALPESATEPAAAPRLDLVANTVEPLLAGSPAGYVNEVGVSGRVEEVLSKIPFRASKIPFRVQNSETIWQITLQTDAGPVWGTWQGDLPFDVRQYPEGYLRHSEEHLRYPEGYLRHPEGHLRQLRVAVRGVVHTNNYEPPVVHELRGYLKRRNRADLLPVIEETLDAHPVKKPIWVRVTRQTLRFHTIDMDGMDGGGENAR